MASPSTRAPDYADEQTSFLQSSAQACGGDSPRQPPSETILMPPFEDTTAPEIARDRPALFRRWVFVLVPVSLLLGVAATAFQFRDEYNPFWERTSEFREAQGLAVTLHKRPLTDPEFNQALELCEVGHVQARTDAVSVVEESVKRDPTRGDAALPVLQRVARTRHAKPRAAAERVLMWMEGHRGPK